MRHDIALALTALGCAVIAVAVVSAVAARGGILNRLHLVTPVTSLGAPLVATGLCIQSGQPWVIAEVLLITLLLFVTGPVLEMATGHVAAQQQGLVREEQPE